MVLFVVFSSRIATNISQISLEQFRSNVNHEVILSDWKNCSILKSQSISNSEMLQGNVFVR